MSASLRADLFTRLCMDCPPFPSSKKKGARLFQYNSEEIPVFLSCGMVATNFQPSTFNLPICEDVRRVYDDM
jgi:hypothetical protein